jgi:hypothetical protein
MGILEKALKKLSELFPGVRRELSELASIAASQQDYLTQAYRESNPYEDDTYDDGEIRASKSETFDIDGLFSDL